MSNKCIHYYELTQILALSKHRPCSLCSTENNVVIHLEEHKCPKEIEGGIIYGSLSNIKAARSKRER
jgi:hypothetical protein